MSELTHEQIRNFIAKDGCLLNKVILVTGAGAGIGKQAALTYASYGATVLLLGRTTCKLEDVYEEIENTGGVQPAIIPMRLDSATSADMYKLSEHIENEFGRLDGILHNASELGEIMPLKEYDIELFERIMHINCTSVFMMTKIFMPLLEKAKNASVVFTTSSVGSKPRANWGAYALSKQAIEGMSDIFTQEMPDSYIRFNCINPGGTQTEMRAKAYPDEDPSRLKTPTDIMPTYVCLMADDSISIKGQVIDCQPK